MTMFLNQQFDHFKQRKVSRQSILAFNFLLLFQWNDMKKSWKFKAFCASKLKIFPSTWWSVWVAQTIQTIPESLSTNTHSTKECSPICISIALGILLKLQLKYYSCFLFVIDVINFFPSSLSSFSLVFLQQFRECFQFGAYTVNQQQMVLIFSIPHHGRSEYKIGGLFWFVWFWLAVLPAEVVVLEICVGFLTEAGLSDKSSRQISLISNTIVLSFFRGSQQKYFGASVTVLNSQRRRFRTL